MSNNYCRVIAEAGVNHNGSLDLALKLIDVAADAGADIVKFQTFKPNLLVTSSAPTAEYQESTTGQKTQMEMLKSLELSKNEYKELFAYSKNRGIKCLSTPFDVESLALLIELGVDIIKIPSGEITNGPFLLEITRVGKPMILSTGMATLHEIEQALAVLSFGIENKTGSPSSFQECWDVWNKQYKDTKKLNELVTILHCTTNYPASLDSINMNAMHTIKEYFGLPVGYSDHSLGITVPIVAASMGAVIIEKHITLDKKMDGPDHLASLEPHELKEMVIKIREVERIRGSYEKKPSSEEMKNISVARRGLYASDNINVGEPFEKEKISILRPQNQSSPMKFWDLIHSTSSKNYRKDEAI